MWTFVSREPRDTQELGRLLAAVAEPGTVVALSGDMGAGKTCFAQGVGEGLWVAGPIVSPTFVLVAEYEGQLPLLHADLWRLERGEAEQTGLEEALESWRGVALVEWADRFPELLPWDHLRVLLLHREAGRELRVEATGPRHEEILFRWKERWDALV